MGSSVAYNLSNRGEDCVLIDSNLSVRGSWGHARSVHNDQDAALRLQSVRRSINQFKRLEEQSGLKILHQVVGSPRHCDEQYEKRSKITLFDEHNVPWCIKSPSEMENFIPGLNTFGNESTLLFCALDS